MKRNGETDDESEIFFDAVKDVKRIRHNHAEGLPSGARPPGRPRPAPARSEDEKEDKTDSFVRPGISRKVLSKLRKEHISSRYELDLHGFTASESQRELQSFLLQAQSADGRRPVRIIHGRGLHSPNQKSVLREKLPGWLQQCEAVLAFVPAAFAHGGPGAVHVLLKRR